MICLLFSFMFHNTFLLSDPDLNLLCSRRNLCIKKFAPDPNAQAKDHEEFLRHHDVAEDPKSSEAELDADGT